MQKPHPPLWVACSNIQTIASAGRWGMGALGFQFVSPEAARAWVHRYYTSLTAAPGQARRLSGQPQHRDGQRLHVRADRRGGARARPRAGRSSCSASRHYGRHGMPTPGAGQHVGGCTRSGATPPRRRRRCAAASSARPRRSASGCASSRRPAWTRSSCSNQAGRTPHEDICASLELFAREVMPEFHAREPEHQRWKADVLAGRIDLERLDTPTASSSTRTRTRTSSASPRPS